MTTATTRAGEPALPPMSRQDVDTITAEFAHAIQEAARIATLRRRGLPVGVQTAPASKEAGERLKDPRVRAVLDRLREQVAEATKEATLELHALGVEAYVGEPQPLPEPTDGREALRLMIREALREFFPVPEVGAGA